MDISRISASSYQVYDDCPWKWFLKYNLFLREGGSAATVMGNMAHKFLQILSLAAIKQIPSDNPVWDFDKLWHKVFNHYHKHQTIEASMIDSTKLNKIIKCLDQLLLGEYSPITTKTLSAEEHFEIDIQLRKHNRKIRLNGFIDRIDKISDDTIEVIDYKTGMRRSYGKSTQEKHDVLSLYDEIQPRMYHYAASQLYPWATNILVTFIYITDGGAYTVPFTKDDLSTTLTLIKNRCNEILDNNQPERNITWKCKKLCNFGKSGMCQKVWNEVQTCGWDFVKIKYNVLRDYHNEMVNIRTESTNRK